jgi:hypothetical protein
MKRILFLLFILFSFKGIGQVYQVLPQYGYQMPRVDAQLVLKIPSDTTTNKTGIARIGTSLYAGNGTYWSAAGGGSTIDTSSLSSRINLKVNISDTATMLSKYLRISDTTGIWVNNIQKNSTADSIIYYIGSIRYAIKDSIGANSFVRDTIDFGSQFIVTSLGANHVDVRLDTVSSYGAATQYDLSQISGGPTGWETMLAQNENQTNDHFVYIGANQLFFRDDSFNDNTMLGLANNLVQLTTTTGKGFTAQNDTTYITGVTKITGDGTTSAIFRNGNVGIGTPPSVALDVMGDVHFGQGGVYSAGGLLGTDWTNGVTGVGDWYGIGNGTSLVVSDALQSFEFVGGLGGYNFHAGDLTADNNIIALGNLKGSGFKQSYTKVTSFPYTVLLSDYTISVDNGASNVDVTLPDATTCTGQIFVIKRYDDTSIGTLTVSATGCNVQNKSGVFGASATIVAWNAATNDKMTYQSNGTDWEYIQ